MEAGNSYKLWKYNPFEMKDRRFWNSNFYAASGIDFGYGFDSSIVGDLNPAGKHTLSLDNNFNLL